MTKIDDVVVHCKEWDVSPSIEIRSGDVKVIVYGVANAMAFAAAVTAYAKQMQAHDIGLTEGCAYADRVK